MKWKSIRKILPFIGIGIFVYLIIKLDITKILNELNNIKWTYILIAIGLFLIFFITQTLKWFVLAKKQKINIPFKEAFKVNFISDFYGFVTPSKLGSIIRVDYLKRYGGETGKGISNFVLDKILDLSSLFLLVIGVGFIFYAQLMAANYWILIFVIFGIMVLSSFLLYNKRFSRPILRFIHRIFVPKKWKDKSQEIFDSFYKDLPKARFLLFVLILNLVNWVLDYIAIYFVALSLGVEISFIPFLVIMIISTLVAQIPITINGLGTREITQISLFSLFGVESVKIFSMSIINIIISNIIPAIFAIILLLSDRKK